MKTMTYDNKLLSLTRNILLFAVLFSIVIVVNLPVISFDMMYPEQPSIYLANQTITHFRDLINIYLHPMWLHANVPFFRPSGHFLVYQLLTPLLGWHDTRAFIIVNLIFLTLIGFFIIKLYRLLFPSLKFGGYIAFSIYLMHPALSISRLTLMHFEFAYVCFAVMSLYFFVLFCRLNLTADNKQDSIVSDQVITHTFDFRFRHLFFASLLIYVVAATFKESALMMGPVLFCYFLIVFYRPQPLLNYVSNLVRDRQSLFVLSMITLTSLLAGWYIFQAWPSFRYASNSFNLQHSLGTANVMLKDIFGLEHDYIPYGSLPFENSSWRTIVYPPVTQFIVWSLCWLVFYAVFLLVKRKQAYDLDYKKTLLFLLVSTLLFSILPLSWASGAPWHHSLTLVCLSLIMGFAVEFVFHHHRFQATISMLFCLSLSVLIALTGITVNRENISKYNLVKDGKLGLQLNRNAVYYPPAIKNQLNADSLIVVEDSVLHSDYMLGNAAYPFLLFLTEEDYNILRQKERNYYLTYHHTYSGNLFKYAYLMPTLKEELYPFQIERMNDIPNEIIYNWLKHINNIFCFGYDLQANWHDKTIAFKHYLLKEQNARQLTINNYTPYPVAFKHRYATYTRKLSYPDAELCQFTCDQDNACKGFIYASSSTREHSSTQCYFYKTAYHPNEQPCAQCMDYIKGRSVRAAQTH